MRFRRPCHLPAAPRRPARRGRGGFTLIEASLAIVIIGVGVVAAVELLGVGSRANAEAHRLTTGLNLAANVRELAQEKTIDQILALHNQTYQPPRDARNQAIDGLGDWRQSVTAVRANPGSVIVDAGVGSSSRLIRLGVTVTYRGKTVTTEEWLVAATAD